MERLSRGAVGPADERGVAVGAGHGSALEVVAAHLLVPVDFHTMTVWRVPGVAALGEVWAPPELLHSGAVDPFDEEHRLSNCQRIIP